MWGSGSSIHLLPVSPGRETEERRRIQKEQAAKTIQKAWWIHITSRMFKLLKHTVRAAEHCISYDILKRVSPSEAELLKEPTIQCKVRFSRNKYVYREEYHSDQMPHCPLGDCTSPILFPCFEERNLPPPMAAVDACRLMGYRKYYKQMLHEELQHKKYGITDEVDVATIRDYIQYVSRMDETPAYFGGKRNYWRRLSLEDLPRAMIMYDIMDYTQSGKLSARLRMELPFLLLRPQNEETLYDQIMAVCQIRSPSPYPIVASVSSRYSSRITGRRSFQTQQKIAKMRKAYRAKKDIEARPSSGRSGSTASLSEYMSMQSLLADEDWEHEAMKLYDWAKSLRADDIGED